MKNHAALLVSLVIAATASQSQTGSYLNLPVSDLDGSNRRLTGYIKDGPVYVTFWALWCVPCLSELKALKSVMAEHEGGKFTILAVNQDSPRSLAKVKSYVYAQKYPFPVLLDPNTQLFQAFSGQVLPLGVFLDRSGRIVKTRTGYIPGDEKEIEKEILSLVGAEKTK